MLMTDFRATWPKSEKDVKNDTSMIAFSVPIPMTVTEIASSGVTEI